VDEHQGRTIGFALDLARSSRDAFGAEAAIQALRTALELVDEDDSQEGELRGRLAAALQAGAATQTVAIGRVPAAQMILDIGPATAKDIADRLAGCRTLVWNGPLGCFEVPPFDAGTNAVAQAAARLTRAGSLLSVAGGGDTVAALTHAGAIDGFSYVSAAGGAFLEWLEGKTLPGIAALEASAAS